MKTILLQIDSGTSIATSIITLAIIVVIFLAARALMLWYWKVNVIVKNQEEQKDYLAAILKELKKNPDSLEEKARKYDESMKS